MSRIITSDVVTLHPSKPGNAILDKLFSPRPEFCFMQREIIDCSDPENTYAGKPLTNTIHESSAGAAEMIGHEFACSDGLAVLVLFDLVAAADVG